jgi:hypothetical protein
MTADNNDKFVTIKEAAYTLELPYWKLLRAVRAGLIPSYQFLTSRRLVLPSEVTAYILSSRKGGAPGGAP